jgi:hypothetical protein
MSYLGKLFQTQCIVVYKTNKFRHPRHICLVGSLEPTIVLVTNPCKPMVDFSWDFTILFSGKTLQHWQEFYALTYCVEILIGDEYAYIPNSSWEQYVQNRNVVRC